jgi:hypothetical protein
VIGMTGPDAPVLPARRGRGVVRFLLCDDLSFTTGSVFDLSGGRTTY